jgi:hypothetical protein
MEQKQPKRRFVFLNQFCKCKFPIEEITMGASGWRYFVPYQPDIQQALQELREDVFKRGEFEQNYTTGSYFREYLAEWEDVYEADSKSLAILRKFAALGDDEIPIPKTIDEAIAATLESTTHSIIDVSEVTELPWEEEGYGIYPITQEDVLRIFGTIQPTHDQVEAINLNNEVLEYGRFQGFYLIVYKDGEPNEIYFEGASGD